MSFFKTLLSRIGTLTTYVTTLWNCAIVKLNEKKDNIAYLHKLRSSNSPAAKQALQLNSAARSQNNLLFFLPTKLALQELNNTLAEHLPYRCSANDTIQHGPYNETQSDCMGPRDMIGQLKRALQHYRLLWNALRARVVHKTFA